MRWFGPFAVALLTYSLASGQDFDKPIKGQVQIGTHEFKLSPEYLYTFRTKSKKYRLEQRFDREDLWVRQDLNYTPDKDGWMTSTSQCSPVKPTTVKVRIAPDFTFEAIGPHAYTLVVERRKLDLKLVLDERGLFDPSKKGKDSTKYPIDLKKGTTYVIEMTVDTSDRVCPDFGRSKKPDDFMNFSSDSSKGGLPARSVFTPKYDGSYYALASLFSTPTKVCNYTLKVFRVEK